MRGHIRQRGERTWAVVVDLGKDPTGKRRQKWHTVHGTKRDAERELARLLREINVGTYVEPPKLTFGEFLERWLQDVARVRVRPKTYEDYAWLVRRYVLPVLGRVPLSSLQPQHLQSLYADLLSSGLSARTVRYVHAVVRMALDQAVKWQILSRSVADTVSQPRQVRREMRVLDVAEAGRLLAVVREERLGALFVLAVSTGLRQGELLGLRWQDVDLDRATVTVRHVLTRVRGRGYVFAEPKTSASRRTLALPELAVSSLRDWKRRQDEEKRLAADEYRDLGLVFCTHFGGPLDSNNVRRAFRRIRERAGLPPVRFHDLRHTHASLLLAAGESVKLVQERLGHATPKMTLDVYSHLLPGMQKAAARKVDDLLGEAASLQTDLQTKRGSKG